MSSGLYVPIPEALADRLDEPQFGPLFEAAIHKALDDHGWPRGARGTIDVPCSYWYVVLWKHGELQGHVGPIPEEDRARRAAASWRDGGIRATVSRRPVGPALTNNY